MFTSESNFVCLLFGAGSGVHSGFIRLFAEKRSQMSLNRGCREQHESTKTVQLWNGKPKHWTEKAAKKCQFSVDLSFQRFQVQVITWLTEIRDTQLFKLPFLPTWITPLWGFSLNSNTFGTGHSSHGQILHLETGRRGKRELKNQSVSGISAVWSELKRKTSDLSSTLHSTNLVIIWLAAGRGSWSHFLLLSLWLLGDGCHGSSCCVAGHKDELWGDGGSEGAVHLQDDRTAIKHTERKQIPVSCVILVFSSCLPYLRSSSSHEKLK